MTDIKSKVQGMDANLSARNIKDFTGQTGNIYEALVLISKRARLLNTDLRYELLQKLDDFAVSSDSIEEVNENKEQIEISKFYEKIPNPTLIATNEYFEGKLEGKEPRRRDDD
jgi:hypothetical protein